MTVLKWKKAALSNCLLLCLTFLAGCADPDDVPASHISTPPDFKVDTAEVEHFPNKVALFGDLHLHTSWSVDAYFGGNRIGPNGAYRVAKGERLELSNGTEIQLEVPLDFVALTDHAEGFDSLLACTTPGQPEFELETCRSWRAGELEVEDMLRQAFENAGKRPMPATETVCGDQGRCQAIEKSTWQRVQEAANAHNEPGRFTALIGYEFSALLAEMGMLHRNVIFRGDAVTPIAISANHVVNQADFFNQLDSACIEPCEVLTIPHNTNYSWGLTFSRNDEDGSSYTREDLERRARIERLFELTQAKGTSECQLGVGASDEDCDFGIIFDACENDDDLRCIRPRSMWRNILLDGLDLGSKGDFNPYKLGVIGSTDNHASDPGHARGIPTTFAPAEGLGFAVDRIFEADHVVAGPVRRWTSGGLAGVWAESNTRGDVFDALQRREAFATSGSRLRIRFFAGELPENIGEASDPVSLAYAHGVPMGGDLEGIASPKFWTWASKDPRGAALDRIQVVKGWIDDGEPMQKIWDVACADGRIPDALGQCPATTATVDVTTCSLAGATGAESLAATFSDPDFDAQVPAFYYVRVFENPTCNWTTQLANSADKDLPVDVDAIVQQRAWSSPIWVASP